MVGNQSKGSTKARALKPEKKNIDDDDDDDKKGTPLLLFLRRLCHNRGHVSAGDARKDNTCEERERERKKTNSRCNNLMFIINFCLNMFRGSLCPSSGEQRPCYCI